VRTCLPSESALQTSKLAWSRTCTDLPPFYLSTMEAIQPSRWAGTVSRGP
jgi:hypothetical protein